MGLPSGIPADNFNPTGNAAEANNLSAQQVYDTLLSSRSQEEHLYVLMAAEQLEMPDDVTAIFTLREGLVYQDRPPVNGRPVRADDVVTMQEFVRDFDAASDATFQRFSMDYVEATDDRTIVFHLRQPNAYLLTGSQLGLPHSNCIIPSEIVLGDIDLTEPVGSGPYQLKSYQFGVRYEYERNPTYRGAGGDLPYIDERVRLPMTDSAALDAAFRSEQIQVWVPPSETADRLERDLGDRIEVDEFLAPALFTWNMSSEREWFNDIRVREAFYRAFNADEFIDLVANGWAVRTPGKLSWALVPYQVDEADVADYIRHDPDEARQLLDAAGFDLDRNYVLTTIASAVNEAAIQVFHEQLRRVGVTNVSIDTRPAAEWIPDLSLTGNYDFVGGVTHPGWDGPQRNLRLNHTDPAARHRAMNIRDPEIDAMIERSETLADREENIEAVHEIQMELTRRYAHLSHIYTSINRELRYSYVRDWELMPWNVVMHRSEAWLDR